MVVSASKIRSGNGTSAGVQTGRGRAAASDRDPPGPDRTVISGTLSQLGRADQPVSPSRLAESFSRTETDFLQQDQVWFELTQQLPLRAAPATPR